jgi:hypothetical protein
MEKTGGPVIPIEHKKRWYLAFAAIHNIVAPRSEPAACLRFKQTGDISFDGKKRLFRIGFIGNRLQKPLGIGMLGIFQHAANRTHFHHVPGIHYRHPVAGFRHHSQIMGNQQDSRFNLPDQFFNKFQNMSQYCDIQGRGRLIGNQQLGAGNQHHGNHDSLGHTTAQFVRIPP